MNKVAPLSQLQVTPTIIKQNQRIGTCRICLQNQKIVQGITKLISPCKCTGSIQKVHEKCMLEWIKTKINHQTTSKNTIVCQICHHSIHFSYRWQIVWDFQCNCNNIGQINNCFLSGFFCSLISIVVLAVILKNSQLLQIKKSSQIIIILSLSSVCLIAVILFLAVLRQILGRNRKVFKKVYGLTQQIQNSSDRDNQHSSSNTIQRSSTY